MGNERVVSEDKHHEVSSGVILADKLTGRQTRSDRLTIVLAVRCIGQRELQSSSCRPPGGQVKHETAVWRMNRCYLAVDHESQSVGNVAFVCLDRFWKQFLRLAFPSLKTA